MKETLSAVSKRFIVTIIATAVFSVGALAVVLYQTNTVQFGDSVSSSELHSLVDGNDAVVEYLESEKDFEAHFVTIANLVKEDQRQALGDALLMAVIPVLVLVIVVGYVVARYLLRPVRESYESQERFMQDAAHELRNPLAAMSLALENTRGKGNKPDADFVTTMRRQTKRLIRINEDLLYLERRKPGVKIQNINLSDLLHDILEDLQGAASHKNVTFNTDITRDVMYKIDPKDFVKLSRNIIENAIKYTKPGTKIAVSLHNNKHTVLTVQDQGIGIPKQDLLHIGERFYRASNVGNVDGTGLGIAIVKKVLNVYGGDIAFESKKGTGTTVSVTLR